MGYERRADAEARIARDLHLGARRARSAPPAPRARRLTQLPAWALHLFVAPALLKDVRRELGVSPQTLVEMVTWAELQELLVSPGKAPHWQLTERGAAAAAACEAARLDACGRVA